MPYSLLVIVLYLSVLSQNVHVYQLYAHSIGFLLFPGNPHLYASLESVQLLTEKRVQ